MERETKNSQVRKLTPEEIEEASKIYTRPLTLAERIEKERLNACVPDTSKVKSNAEFNKRR